MHYKAAARLPWHKSSASRCCIATSAWRTPKKRGFVLLQGHAGHTSNGRSPYVVPPGRTADRTTNGPPQHLARTPGPGPPMRLCNSWRTQLLSPPLLSDAIVRSGDEILALSFLQNFGLLSESTQSSLPAQCCVLKSCASCLSAQKEIGRKTQHSTAQKYLHLIVAFIA